MSNITQYNCKKAGVIVFNTSFCESVYYQFVLRESLRLKLLSLVENEYFISSVWYTAIPEAQGLHLLSAYIKITQK